MNLSLFTIVCLKLQGSEPLCRHTPAISSQCKRQGIFILVFVAESSKRGRHTAGHCRTSHALYPPQSCPIGGWIHVTITAPPTPGTGLLGPAPSYPTSDRNPMVLHSPCVIIYILISIALFLTYCYFYRIVYSTSPFWKIAKIFIVYYYFVLLLNYFAQLPVFILLLKRTLHFLANIKPIKKPITHHSWPRRVGENVHGSRSKVCPFCDIIMW